MPSTEIELGRYGQRYSEEEDERRQDAPFLGLGRSDVASPRLAPGLGMGRTRRAGALSGDGDGDGDGENGNGKWWQARSPLAVVVLLSVTKFICVMCCLLMLMPVYRFVEDTFCHVHYADDSPGLMDEMACKVDEVQSSMAVLMGAMGLLGGVVNLLAAYPYGLMADSIGRKPTALMAYAGTVACFYLTSLAMGPGRYLVRDKPYVLLLTAIVSIFGGGVRVFTSTMYAMVSDVSTDKDKASNFLYLTMGSVAGSLLGPLLAGLLMEKWGPWIPVTTVLCISPLVFVLFLFIPETLSGSSDGINSKQTGTSPGAPGHGRSSSISKHPVMPINLPHGGGRPTLATTLARHVRDGLADLRRSLGMLRDVNVLLCMVTFFFNNARWTANSSTQAQYISKNFGWTLAQTSILLSPLGLVEMLLLAAMPMLSRFLMGWLSSTPDNDNDDEEQQQQPAEDEKRTAHKKDMLICRASLLLLTASALVRALSPDIRTFVAGLVVGALGAAHSPVARAVMSGYVDPSYTSRLYALTSMVEIAGTVAGAPVLAWCFTAGVRLRGVWTALPWFYLALVCAVSLGALLFVRPPGRVWNEDAAYDLVDSEDEDDMAPQGV